ncbi:unnamed protein product, partial [Effrenium voratum]
ALVQINAALRSNTQLIFGQRVADGRSFFKAMDKDQSGTLDRSEVGRGLRRLGLEVSEPLLEEILDTVDANRNGLVEMREFLQALKDPRPAQPAEPERADSPGGDEILSAAPANEAGSSPSGPADAEPLRASEGASEAPKESRKASPSTPRGSQTARKSQVSVSSSPSSPKRPSKAATSTPTRRSTRLEVVNRGSPRPERTSYAAIHKPP